MSERRDGANRQCARFGCSAVASATYTFDSATCTVWLDTPLEGAARAGELCSRHAGSLTPPRGWRLEDRRQLPTHEVSSSVARASALASASASSMSSAAVSAPAHASSARTAAAGASSAVVSTTLRAGLDDELRGLLDAHSPLLARAFRSSGAV